MQTKRFFISVILFVGMLTSTFAQEKATYEEENEIPHSIRDFRVSIGGGYAYHLGKIEKTGDAKLDDLNKQLRHGYTLDADAQYFLKPGWGFGLNVNFCSSSTSGKNIDIPNFGNVNSYKESQNMLFAGPSFVSRNESEKFLMVTSIALGPLFYLDRITINGATVNGKQTTLGFNAGIAGEYKLNNKTGVGLKLSYTIGTINSINIEGQKMEYNEPVSLSNLMATVFLSFRSW